MLDFDGDVEQPTPIENEHMHSFVMVVGCVVDRSMVVVMSRGLKNPRGFSQGYEG